MAENLRHRGNNAVGVQAQSTINDTERRRIVLLGKTGVGKSSAGNTILGEKRFECKKSLNSVTKQCSVEESVVGGRYVTVIDTPGFFDITVPEEKLSEQIAWSLFESAPGAHAFLFVLSLDRFTEQEKAVLTEIQNIFGENVLKYLIILFTNGDGIELETFDSEVKKHKLLGPIVKSCQGYHVFNNTDQTNRKQVTVLMQKIETMIEQNGGRHYTNEMYQDAQRFRQEEEENIRREEERRNREELEYSGEYVVFPESQRLILQKERYRESYYSKRARMSGFARFFQRFRSFFRGIANRILRRRHN